MGRRGDSGHLAFLILGSFSRAPNGVQIHLKTPLPLFFSPTFFSSEIRQASEIYFSSTITACPWIGTTAPAPPAPLPVLLPWPCSLAAPPLVFLRSHREVCAVLIECP